MGFPEGSSIHERARPVREETGSAASRDVRLRYPDAHAVRARRGQGDACNEDGAG